ncbi:hypothetical protein A2U01_0021968, partial [Trifolium medium]|nr:hypothetical protein [Trifolium medium]
MKQGRVVASRYNSGGDVRKRWEIPIEEDFDVE